MRNSILVVLNPASGGGSTGDNSTSVQRKVRSLLGSDVQIEETQKTGQATVLTRNALREGKVSMVVAIGGDGTANEVLNGFFETKHDKVIAMNADASMAFIPSGTRNVLAKSFSLPEGINANLRRVEAAAKANASRLVDVGIARMGRMGAGPSVKLFLNAAEVGLGAHIIDRSRKIRKVVNSRTLSTLATILTTVPTYRSNQCEVSLDDGEWRMFPHITICLVSNGVYLGGSFKMAPRANTSDGLLDLTIVKDSGSFKLLTQLFNMKTGEFADAENVQYEQSKKIAVRSEERDVEVTVDGESAGFLPAVFEILPKALRFV